MIDYEIQIWEKEENWNFYQTYRANSHAEAIAMARKEYPARHYVVRG